MEGGLAQGKDGLVVCTRPGRASEDPIPTTAPAPAVHARGSAAPAGKRLASTIRLPWLAGLASLLLLAVVTAALAFRAGGEAGVVQAVLDAEEAAAAGAAQSVRRSLNEGSDDLQQAADALQEQVDQGTVRADRAATVLRSTVANHQRYLALGLARAADGGFVLTPPGEPLPAPLGEVPDDVRDVRLLEDGRLVETVPVAGDRGLVVAAVYDPLFLVPAFAPPPLGFAVAHADGRVVAETGLGLPAAGEDVGERLERARDRGTTSAVEAGGPARAVVSAVSPVTGVGPAGEAELVVVVSRDVEATSDAGSPALRRGLLAAVLVLLVTAAVYALLHVAVVRPVLALQRDAERVAYGDLSRPVVTDQYDEVGSTSRAFERLRLALIRAQVQEIDVDVDRRDGRTT